jgi:hypothetical protein
MPGLAVVAAVVPDNTPHGYNLTFAVPVALFVVVAIALYLLFSRPHQRIPARRGVLPARLMGAPDPDAARAAAVAGGLGVAAGGGAAESHLEAAGHIYATPDATEPAAEASPADAGAGEAGAADAGAADASVGEAGSGETGAGPPDGDGPAPSDRAEGGQ